MVRIRETVARPCEFLGLGSQPRDLFSTPVHAIFLLAAFRAALPLSERCPDVRFLSQADISACLRNVCITPPSKADTETCLRDVRFTPESGH